MMKKLTGGIGDESVLLIGFGLDLLPEDGGEVLAVENSGEDNEGE